MAQCRSHTTLFLFGAAAGAAAALLLIPSTRRALLNGAQKVIDDLREGDLLSPEHITHEAGAVEGGLAGTRRWSDTYSGA